MDVSLDDVGFRLVGHVRPVADLVDVPEKENAFSLTTADLFLKELLRVS